MGPFDHAEPAGSDAQPRTGKVVGSVAELWRYPVKSMRGGTVSQLLITDRGSVGDRAWALRDPINGRIASAKRFPQLLEFRATYEVEPTMTTSGRVRVEAPNGQSVYADHPAASELSSRAWPFEPFISRTTPQPVDGEITIVEWKSPGSPL